MRQLKILSHSYDWKVKKLPVMERALKTAKISSVSILINCGYGRV